jgi:hydrogenase maturation protease
MLVVIGYGNPLRRDDGAGPALARMIEKRFGRDTLKVIVIHQLVPEIAEELARKEVEAVLFLDAGTSGASEQQQVAIHPVAAEASSPALGHHFSPVDLLAYTELFRGTPLSGWQLTIHGSDFGFGEGLGSQAKKSLAEAGERLEVFIRENFGQPDVASGADIG